MRRGLAGMLAAAVLAVCCPGVASGATTWTVQSVPLPAGYNVETLFSVSCPTAARCTAVGGDGAAVDSWNGSIWSVRSIPLPVGATDSILSAVSCASATSCTVVGDYFKASGPELMLAEHWNGSTWSVQAAPAPSGSRGSQLYAVSCASATSCTAAGDYGTSAGTSPATLAEHWNGRTWSVQATPNPAGSHNANFSGVSCTSATSCTAVGQASATTGSGLPRMLAEHWNGRTWSIQATPNPAGSAFSDLSGISCASATSCMAVGGSDAGTLAEQWNGRTWSVHAVPAPAGQRIFSLPSVSCVSATGCTAVGWFFNSSSVPVAVAEHWNGLAWSVRATAQPANQKLFNAVSCTASFTCTAVGAKTIDGITTSPLAERE